MYIMHSLIINLYIVLFSYRSFHVMVYFTKISPALTHVLYEIKELIVITPVATSARIVRFIKPITGHFI